ncbi:hypothetical protein DFQ28_002526 [Apophysomyces sp. BC1034]|nr:hypothetical protein DFQ30_010389 [Apophysomyces sp. BC1015]KAG0182792.1 hypothetical protein DFQ29_002204 [Apophysomyces sp. BC1021]KAG0190052.1 hypothetical protein DFQ28_002526 [Apophysomyces sp. BC1034]
MLLSNPLLLLAVSSPFLHYVRATLSPSIPEPGTVWTAGEEYEITWEEDQMKPSIAEGWKKFKIDLMTGEDEDQILLTNVASNLKGSGSMSYTWKVPDVSPHAPIYFLMFTSDKGENAWTTRFSIVNEDNQQEEPEKPTQPNGTVLKD